MSTVILATADPQTQWSKLTLSNPHHTETVSPSFNPFSPYPSLNLFMFNHDTINILRTFLQNFTPSGVPPPLFFSPSFRNHSWLEQLARADHASTPPLSHITELFLSPSPPLLVPFSHSVSHPPFTCSIIFIIYETGSRTKKEAFCYFRVVLWGAVTVTLFLITNGQSTTKSLSKWNEVSQCCVHDESLHDENKNRALLWV